MNNKQALERKVLKAGWTTKDIIYDSYMDDDGMWVSHVCIAGKTFPEEGNVKAGRKVLAEMMAAEDAVIQWKVLSQYLISMQNQNDGPNDWSTTTNSSISSNEEYNNSECNWESESENNENLDVDEIELSQLYERLGRMYYQTQQLAQAITTYKIQSFDNDDDEDCIQPAF